MANENRYIDTLESENLNSFGQAMEISTHTLCSVKNKELLKKMLTHIVASQFSFELVTTADNILVRMNKESGVKLMEGLQEDVLELTETADYKKLKELVVKRIATCNH